MAHARFAMPPRVPNARSATHRTLFTLAWTASLLALFGATSGCAPSEPTPPNLLLLTIDSLRADFLGCYGGEPSVGVRLCALADEGARYEWAFSPASESAPAIAAILSSQPPWTSGVDGSAATFLPDATTTVAEELRRAGYATAAFVGSPELNRSRRFGQGFGLYDDDLDERAPERLAERRARATTSAALAWLADAPEPWFVWIHYRDPHGPYDPPERELTPPAIARARGERLRRLSTPTGRGGIPGYQALPGLFTREAYESRYRAEIRHVDGQIARLLSELETREIDPGVLVTADHGESFGEDLYYFTHGHSVGLSQIRVPLIWRAPGGAPPVVVSRPVSTLDISPSLLQAAGIVAPEAFEGRALPHPDHQHGPLSVGRLLFATGGGQIAVIASGSYYARRMEPAKLARLSRSELRRAEARTAVLAQSTARPGRLPPYRPALPGGVADLLEPEIEAFLTHATPEEELEAVSEGPRPEIE